DLEGVTWRGTVLLLSHFSPRHPVDPERSETKATPSPLRVPMLHNGRPMPSPNDDPPAPGRAHRHRFEGPFWRRLMLGGIKHIPPSLQIASMPLWASIFYALVPSARRTVEENLERVMGPAPAPLAHLRSFR